MHWGECSHHRIIAAKSNSIKRRALYYFHRTLSVIFQSGYRNTTYSLFLLQLDLITPRKNKSRVTWFAWALWLHNLLSRVATRALHFLIQQKEECTKKIRELGSLPADAFDKHQKTPIKAVSETGRHGLIVGYTNIVGLKVVKWFSLHTGDLSCILCWGAEVESTFFPPRWW